jgi:exodeoxyribonuclease VII large subunit
VSFNIPEFSVAEFSRTIKRLVEDAFGYVRIKGEVSGFKRAASGHLYFTLKEGESTLSAVCFRNMAQAIDFEVADGLQLVASGRITTFDGRSNYQIIIEKLEVAGIGAIMEMIEKRRQRLLAEGLFDEIHKKKIPFFPKKIAVITSPTGAVIEDIKHRIEARCPAHVMLYPASVQGQKAAQEIIAGIRFFNNLSAVKKPDVLIIARGGGSFEDLLCFNDEDLVRAVSKSEIPVISAVGHETDVTLIDYVADLRAPTPTAAAELATPVLAQLQDKLNFAQEKLENLPKNFLAQRLLQLNNLQRYMISPAKIVEQMQEKFLTLTKNFTFFPAEILAKKNQQLAVLKISNDLLLQKISDESKKIESAINALKSRLNDFLTKEEKHLKSLEKLLISNHYHEILKRGFCVIKDEKNHLISSVLQVCAKQNLTIEMHDGSLQAEASSNAKFLNS